MMKKYLVNTTVFLVFFLSLFAVINFLHMHSQQMQNQDSWQTIKKRKEITLGLDDTFVPMGFRDKQGKLTGFDVQLADKVFAELGIKVNWQTIDWPMKETELNSRNIDGIWSGYSITPEREKKVAFSIPYHYGVQVLVTRAADHINSLADMTNKILAVQTSSSGAKEFAEKPNLLKKYVKNHQAINYDTFDKAFNDLNAKRVDGILIDADYANYYISHQKNADDYKIAEVGYAKELNAVGFRKQDKILIEKVNEELKKLKEDGFIQRLSEKWFGKSE